MITYKILANRQLTEYSGSDKYINVSSIDILNEVFDDIQSGKITTINSKNLKVEVKGKTTNIHFLTKDVILDTEYKTFFAKGSRELRYQLTNYVHDRHVIPGDIITILIEKDDTNCDIKIKSESIYKYVLERKSKGDNRYRLMIEHPTGTNNAGVTSNEFTNEYLSKFGIKKLDETATFGKSITEFTLYSLDGCDKNYIGVPYMNFECDCFDNAEEIYL
ncbi:hypothetical protein CRU99_03465 [Malaciobacter mytili]|uniref:hypothetical protein n=1 Tax=Malaciobacter mytili TaxID=603050 RepID=UPI00100A3310|nr:hypothetical protein [Malaciobacter mytili]RXI45767.1 hypothetical protein CRU99_03465 [Malaciobacter mytili]